VYITRNTYKFNCGIEKVISSANPKLTTVKPSVPDEKEALRKAGRQYETIGN